MLVFIVEKSSEFFKLLLFGDGEDDLLKRKRKSASGDAKKVSPKFSNHLDVILARPHPKSTKHEMFNTLPLEESKNPSHPVSHSLLDFCADQSSCCARSPGSHKLCAHWAAADNINFERVFEITLVVAEEDDARGKYQGIRIVRTAR